MANRNNIATDDDLPVLKKGSTPIISEDDDLPVFKKKSSSSPLVSSDTPSKSSPPLSAEQRQKEVDYLNSPQANSGKPLSEHPFTTEPAKEVGQIEQYNHVVKLQDINQSLKDSPDLESAIYKFNKVKDPNLLSGTKKAQILDRTLNDPDFNNTISQNGKLIDDARSIKNNLVYTSPGYVAKQVEQKIGQHIQDSGKNSLIYENKSPEEMDAIVDEMANSGKLSPQEKSFYLHNREVMRDAVKQQSPDLLHSAKRGLESGIGGVESSLRDIGNKATGGLLQKAGVLETDEARTGRLQDEQAKTPQIEAKSFGAKAVSGIGQFTGYVAPMILNSILTKGAGMSEQVAEIAPAVLQFEGGNADRSREISNDPKVQYLYTLLGTGFDAIIGSKLPTGKIAKGITGLIKNDIAKAATEMTEDNAANEVIKKNLFQKIKNITGGVLEGNTTTATGVTVYDQLHKVLDAAFGQRDFQGEEDMKDALKTFGSAWLSSTGLSLGGAALGRVSPKIVGKNLVEKAENPEQTIQDVQDAAHESPAIEAKQHDIIKNVMDAHKAWGVIKELPLTEAQKEKFLVKEMQQKVLDKQAASAPIDVIKNEIQDKANEAYKEKLQIYNGTDQAKEHENYQQDVPKTPEETEQEVSKSLGEDKSKEVAAHVREFVDNDLLPENLPAYEKEGAKQFPLQFLSNVAEQLHTVDKVEEGKTASPRETTESKYGSEIVKLAEEYFPEKKITEEDLKKPTITFEAPGFTEGKKIGLIKNSKGAIYHERHQQTLERLGYSKEEIDNMSQHELSQIILHNIENPNVENSAKITGGQNALQEQSPSSVLQHPQSSTGETGGERGGMESEQQGEEATGTRPEEKETGGEEVVESGEPKKIGVHHAALTNLAEEIGLPKPQREEYISPEEHAGRGRKLVEAGASVNEVDNKNNELHDRISVGRAYLEKYYNQLNYLRNTKGIESKEYKEKKQQVEELSGKIKELGSKAGQGMTSLQGERDMDTGNFEVLRQAFVDKTGKEPSPAQEKVIKDLSDKVKGLSEDVEKLQTKLTEALDKAAGGKGKFAGKAKKAADVFRKLKQTPFKFKDSEGNEHDIQSMGIGWNDLVELGAKAIEKTGEIADGIAEVIDKIKGEVWYDKLSDKDKDAFAEQLQDHYEKAIENTPEAKSVKRLEKQLDDLRNGIVKQKGIKIEETPEIKDLKEQIFEAKKNLGLIKPKDVPAQKENISEEQKRINRLEKQLSDLQQGIVKEKTEPFEDTPAIKQLKDKIFEAKKDLGLIKPKSTKSTTSDLKITAAEKKIASLEKEKENLENGIIKQKTISKEEPSPAQKARIEELNNDIHDLKKDLGLLKSKAAKPATEKETIEEDKGKAQKIAEQFADKKDNKFTPEEASDIWNYAKENYLDKGSDFDQMISGTAMDLGLNPDQVRDALTTPKGTKAITDEMYKKQNERNTAIQRAKDWARDANTNPLVKFIRSVPRFFFAAKVFGHGTVGMITHAGKNIYDPVEWKRYWPVFFKQFKFAYGSQADYEKSMQDLQNDPQFQFWKRNGLAVDPSERYDEYQYITKMFEKMGKVGRWLTAGDRGFNALKVYRLERAKALWNNLSDIEKADKNTAKEIAKEVNHSSGTVGLKVSEVANTAFFAPKLELARWNSLLVDPAKAVKTFVSWNNASPAEKVAAKIVAGRAARILSTYIASLAVNQGLLSLSGSNQTINFTNPLSSDWLKFKTGGRTIDATGGMISLLGFLTRMGHAAIPGVELKGKSAKDELMNQSWSYVSGKLSPFASTVKDVATHHDFAGNTLPFYNDKPLHSWNTKLSLKEYLEKQQTPIPVAEFFTDFDKQLQEQGVPKSKSMEVIQSLLVAGLVGGTGVHIGEEPQAKPTPFNDMDKKDPVFKVFYDKGLELPNTSLSSEKVKDKTSHTEKKISDYPDEIQKEYQSVHKSYLRESLADIIKKGYVFVNPYGDVATHRNEEGKRKEIKDLTKEEMAKVLHIAQSEATTKAKKKVFKLK